MTLRVKYDEVFRTWDVQYYNGDNDKWFNCTDYYPKTGRSYASFKTQEEAEEFMCWKYGKSRVEMSAALNRKPMAVPADYYGVRGRYYGD